MVRFPGAPESQRAENQRECEEGGEVDERAHPERSPRDLELPCEELEGETRCPATRAATRLAP
jgi:hypothetical protein